MKGIVIYDSSYGNTRKIGETITDALNECGIETDFKYVKDVRKVSTGDYAFLVVGSPTRFGTMSFAMKALLGKVDEKEWAGRPFAAYGTENPESIEKKQSNAAEKIAEKLQEKQMKQLVPALRGIALDWKGPLQDGEIKRAKDYAREFAGKLKQQIN